MIGLVIWAMIPDQTVGLALVLCGITIPVGLGAARVWLLFYRFQVDRKRLSHVLVSSDGPLLAGQLESPLLQEVFDLFDVNKSGDVSIGEVRTLLQSMYPSIPRKHLKAALTLHTSSNGKLTVDDLGPLILEWRHYARENDPEKSWLQARQISLETVSAVAIHTAVLTHQQTVSLSSGAAIQTAALTCGAAKTSVRLKKPMQHFQFRGKWPGRSRAIKDDTSNTQFWT